MACGHQPCSCDRDEDGILAFFEAMGFPITPWTPPPGDSSWARWRLQCGPAGPEIPETWLAATPSKLWEKWHAKRYFAFLVSREHRRNILCSTYEQGDETYQALVNHGLLNGHVYGLAVLYDVPRPTGCPVEALLALRPDNVEVSGGELAAILYVRRALTAAAIKAERRNLEKRLPGAPGQAPIRSVRL